MSEQVAQTPTEQKPKKVLPKKVVEETFSMNFWEDERLARKFMKENLLTISQKAANGEKPWPKPVKTHFARLKDDGNGLAVMEVQFAETTVVTKADGSVHTKHEFTGNDYIRVTYDANRKFPKAEKVERDEDGNPVKKGGTLRKMVTNR